MAKQIGLYSVRGKVDGFKYYGMKGVANTIIAKINEGMSSRVKNSAEYANTRLNNAEFGAAGNMAGTLVRALTQRWRCVTIPFATAKFLPSIKRALALDTTNPWGQRTLTGTAWQDGLRQEMTNLSKVAFDEEMGLVIEVTNDKGTNIAVTLKGNIAQAEYLKQKGIDGIKVDLVAFRLNAAEYDDELKGYVPASLVASEASSLAVTLDSALDEDLSVSMSGQKVDASKVMTAVLLVFKPFRTISGEDYVAQEFCCHKLVAIPAEA